MSQRAQPLVEVDRFFPAPPDRRPPQSDAQSQAVERMVLTCERIRPHLHSLDSLERFLRLLHDPPRARRRISLALAIEMPDASVIYGQVGRRELEAFRRIAQRRLASVLWVFS